MDNIYDMLARTNLLNESMENERKEAAKRLHNNFCAFIAHYGQVYKSKGCSYSFIRNGEEVELENLNIEEMEILHKFMVDTLNNDPQYQEDEIDRYQNLCL
jgi:hypothetical protein